MTVDICAEPFDPWSQLQTYQQQAEFAGQCGAMSVFVGTMRDSNEGAQVTAMYLEHYPAMTGKYLETLAAEAVRRWSLLDILIVHRVGDIRVDDPIVLVAVWSIHRKAAFEACRHVMEELKSNAPFWKKEQLENGSRWVEGNTPG